MSENLEACMGGWCSKREKCPHHQADDRSHPAERLCPTGRDGEMLRRLRTDPRFGAWAAGAPDDLDEVAA